MKRFFHTGLILISVFLCACGNLSPSNEPEAASVSSVETAVEEAHAEYTFRDVVGNVYTAILKEDVPKNTYDNEYFVHDGQLLSYNDAAYTCDLGVDVSHHQDKIDWQKVAEAGYKFAFIRLGFRGYGQTGSINLDREFERNYSEARANGLEVGVYFFSQAINEIEAKEEADFVLSTLAGRPLELPVVYDPESILDAEARTDNVTGEQFTANTITFCNEIRNAGYAPAIYSNMRWEAFFFDLSALTDLPVWYADYEPYPQTPYHFTYWQYTCEGTVPGIPGPCDINIRIVPK